MIAKIDLDQLISSKKPGLAKRMPRPVKAFLRRILHIDEVNRFLNEHNAEEGLDFARSGMQFVGLEVRVSGIERLASTDRPLIAANHPLGGLDGIAVMIEVGRVCGSVKLLVNDFLMAVTNLHAHFVPVNKHGSGRAYKGLLEEAVQSAAPLVIFPAGVCSRKLPSGIYDLEWNKSFVRMSRDGNRPVVPIYVGGRNSRFFYMLANLRRLLGVKGNIEMLFLVDEMLKQRNLTLDLIVGEPIQPEVFSRERDDWEWARRVRDYVYTLRDGEVRSFDPLREPILPKAYFAGY